MQYLLSFLEGIGTFISPCLLPMLPMYLTYFAGQKQDAKKHKVVLNSIGFVLGFTLLFVVLGAFAGSIGMFLKQYATAVNIVCGGMMILFGLNFMGVIRIGFLNKTHSSAKATSITGFFSAVLFGIIFSISWTPCVTAFLGSAIMMAAQTGETLKGILMLLSFSMGLGIPFVASAVLIDSLKSAFDFLKKHNEKISKISGLVLVVLGILVATGLIARVYSLL